MTHAPIIVWFRLDLRLADNPALAAAADSGAPILPVYVLDDDSPGTWAMGGASRWWLHGSLEALGHSLARHHLPLVLRRGDARVIVPALARETGAAEVYWNRRYEPWAEARDTAIKQALREAGTVARSFNGSLLHEPWSVRTGAGGSFKVYTPFANACRNMGAPPKPQPAPAHLHGMSLPPAGEVLDSWHLRPSRPDWAGGLRDAWTPGEAGAEELLDTFLADRLDAYSGERDRPDRDGTSQLSPHLHFGEISPRRLWHAAAARGDGQGVATFHRELLWREFNYHLLHHQPQMPDEPLQARFASFSWQRNKAHLTAWQRGLTGYPIVDAGMRQLWHTGWMHNRVRMITASFLIKDLLQPWQDGEAWFWDTLVDADLANNAGNWQWVAGCGADAAPFFRIFNPVLQGRKFDPAGQYVRRWVLELARLPAQHIHTPWEAPDAVLEEARVTLGKTYPRPIVDHGKARNAALAALKQLAES